MRRLRASGCSLPIQLVSTLALVLIGIFTPASPASALPNPAIDGVWSELALSAYPPARHGYSLLYDSTRHRALLFGGYRGSQDFGDVWSLDLSDPVAWQLVAVIGAISVSRGEMAAVYDPVRDRIWAWGGRNASGAVFGEGAYLQFGPAPGESAVWNTVNPNQEPSTGNRPTPRAGQGAVYDPVGRRMIFNGGSYGHTFGTTGTWWLSLDEPPTWHLYAAPSPFPNGATYTSLSLASGGTSLILSGAMGFSGWWQFPLYWSGATWTLAIDGTGNWMPLATSHGELFPDGFTPLRSIYHPAQDRLIGYQRGFTYDWGVTGINEMRIGFLECPLATGQWRSLEPANGPGPPYDVALLYDPIADRMLAVRDSIGPGPSMGTWLLSWGATSGVSGSVPGVSQLRAGRAEPNPSRGRVAFPVELVGESIVEATILNAAGRLVRRLPSENWATGAHRFEWDGRDDAGQHAPPGVYFARVLRSDPPATAVTRIVRMR